MRAIGFLVFAGAVVLTIAAVSGCADSRKSRAQESASKPARLPVEGLCKPPEVPSADLAHKPGYRQFAVSVTNASGLPISGLKQSDFVVSEESRKFPIDYFREHEPVAIELLVDTSGSMEPKLSTVKSRLGNLVENLNRCDEVELFAFSAKPYLLQSFTTNHQMAAKQMELFHAYGQTSLYDATDVALQQLAEADYPNRTIILITDGIDNTSKATEEEVATRARKENVPIYAIGIGEPERSRYSFGALLVSADAERVDDKSLQTLSAASGGRTFIVPGTTEDAGNGFMNALSAIADTIARDYAIGVVIPKDATPGSVNVAVVNRPDLVVRARVITSNPYSP